METVRMAGVLFMLAAGCTHEETCVLGSSETCPATSCLSIQTADASSEDGVFWLQLLEGVQQVRCLMSADGGGWTQVTNFPWQGTSAGVPGWTSGRRVGTSYVDDGVWKMSDVQINAIDHTTYRARGTATSCLQGGCAIDTTLYWNGTCAYNSGSLASGCGVAYTDPGLTARPPGAPSDGTACPQHYGLVSAVCDATSELGTSHIGDHEFVGAPGTYVHAFDGRDGENPSIQVWVR